MDHESDLGKVAKISKKMGPRQVKTEEKVKCEVQNEVKWAYKSQDEYFFRAHENLIQCFSNRVSRHICVSQVFSGVSPNYFVISFL
jgi:hypothetical protein